VSKLHERRGTIGKPPQTEIEDSGTVGRPPQNMVGASVVGGSPDLPPEAGKNSVIDASLAPPKESRHVNRPRTPRASRLTPIRSTAYWQDELPAPGVLQQLPTVVDVAIIGGGLTGLSAALHILRAEPTTRVAVLDAKRIGHGASSRNTGMITPGVGQSLTKLVKRFGASAAQAMYQTSLEAVRYVPQLAAEESVEAEVRLTGQLTVACGRHGGRRLEQQAECMDRLRLPCERLTRSELDDRIRLGVQGAGDGPAALRFPDAGTLHPGKLIRGLAASVQRRGGILCDGAQVASVSRGAPARVRLADGRELQSEHVVVASNGYASGFNPQRGRLLPMHLRVMLTEPVPADRLERLGWMHREGVIDSRRLFNYFRLTEDNRILFGGGQPRYLWGAETADQPADTPDLARLRRDFVRFFPELAGLGIERSWTGVISYSLDTLPVIGFVPGHRRVIHAGGWCGHGIALSLLSGRWIHELITRGRCEEPYPWFRQRAPLVPSEPARWLGVRASGWAMEMLDRL